MRYIAAVALFFAACAPEPLPLPDAGPPADLACVPNLFPATADALCCSGWRDVAGTCVDRPDLASASCGRIGEPCCEDTGGRTFCGEGKCCDGVCMAPDLATPPDMMPAPDLAPSCVPFGIRDAGSAGYGALPCCTGISPTYPELDWCCAPAGAKCQRNGDCCNGAPCDGATKTCQGH